jgi:hypothetical protein
MRNATLLLLGAMPGVAFGYVLLSAYLLTRIRPLPITHLPPASRLNPDPVRNARNIRFSLGGNGRRTTPARER